MTELDRDYLDRICHVVDGDAQEATRCVLRVLGGLACLRGNLFREGFEFLARDIGIRRLIAIRAEHIGEMASLTPR